MRACSAGNCSHSPVQRPFTKKPTSNALGPKAAPAPVFDLGDSLKDADSFGRAAAAVEDLGVAAYNGQVANLTPAALRAAVRIVSVDARHAAWVRSIVGAGPADSAVDRPLSERQVQEQLRRDGFLP